MCYKYPHNVIISQHSSKNGGGGVPLPISYNFNQSDFFIICVKIWSSPCVSNIQLPSFSETEN